MCRVVEAGSHIPQSQAENTEKTLRAYWDLHLHKKHPPPTFFGHMFFPLSLMCNPSFKALSPGGKVTLFESGYPLGNMLVHLTSMHDHVHTYMPHGALPSHPKPQRKAIDAALGCLVSAKLGAGWVPAASSTHLCSFMAVTVLSPCLAPNGC